MKLNFFAYYMDHDGYGRYSSRVVKALIQAGVEVAAHHIGVLDMPAWMQTQHAPDWSRLTISCIPPYMVKRVPGRHWLLSMTEGTRLSDGWAEIVNAAGVERVIVPCQHNADAFKASGVTVPIHVIAGGTDPDEFPLTARVPGKPYTFLTFADRGFRKGWDEVWEAFYRAFGDEFDGDQDVRLIIKYRNGEDNVTSVMAAANSAETRIVYDASDTPDIATLYAQADCLVLPSRSEGWGMIQREAAMMGLPVITQAYSGLDDGHTRAWAMVVEAGALERIPPGAASARGEWRVVDVAALAAKMRECYENPGAAAAFGYAASSWLRQQQTWGHTAAALIELMRESAPERGEYQHA